MFKFISNGDWFDKGTEAELLDDYAPDLPNVGLFQGFRDGKLVQEVCRYREIERHLEVLTRDVPNAT